MTTDRIDALEALLAEAEAAHGVVERTELHGVYDADWPRWYAGYLIDHGVGEHLMRPVTVEELTALLADRWEEAQRAEPPLTEPWPSRTARQLASEPWTVPRVKERAWPAERGPGACPGR